MKIANSKSLSRDQVKDLARISRNKMNFSVVITANWTLLDSDETMFCCPKSAAAIKKKKNLCTELLHKQATV